MADEEERRPLRHLKFREFENVSGYSLYRAVQEAKSKGKGSISLGK